MGEFRPLKSPGNHLYTFLLIEAFLSNSDLVSMQNFKKVGLSIANFYDIINALDLSDSTICVNLL